MTKLEEQGQAEVEGVSAGNAGNEVDHGALMRLHFKTSTTSHLSNSIVSIFM
jgi:hypothetical protein